jgi:multidrug efflux pump subunit AcrA (membrane-fusion protein)
LRALALMVLLGCAVVAGSLLSRPAGTGTPDAARPAALVPGIIHATRGDVRSVLVLDGAVAAVEAFELKSPLDGAVRSIEAAPGVIAAGTALAVVDGSAGLATIRMPEAGALVSVAVVQGQSVSVGQALFVIAPARYTVVVQVDPAYLYRLYEPPISIVVQLDRGPAAFPCPLLSLGASLAEGGNPLDAPVTLVCRVPPELRAFTGVRAQAAITTAEAHDVLLLPVEAVEGSADQGVVTLVRAGAHVRQSVHLGITDGTNVAIVDGLSVTDDVLEFPDPSAALSRP